MESSVFKLIKETIVGKPPPTMREMKRENRRASKRAAREINKQVADLDKRESEMLKKLKASCKKGDHKMSKAISLDIVRVRKTKHKVANAASAQISVETTISNSINGAAVVDSMTFCQRHRRTEWRMAAMTAHGGSTTRS